MSGRNKIGRDRINNDWQAGMAGFDGKALHDWRKKRNLSQDAMAALLGMMSPNSARSIQNYESGLTRIPDWVRRMVWLMDRVQDLADRLGQLRRQSDRKFESDEEGKKGRRRRRKKEEKKEDKTEWVKPMTAAGEASAPMPVTRTYTKRSEYWGKRKRER